LPGGTGIKPRTPDSGKLGSRLTFESGISRNLVREFVVVEIKARVPSSTAE
jgi:hypothetical protein